MFMLQTINRGMTRKSRKPTYQFLLIYEGIEKWYFTAKSPFGAVRKLVMAIYRKQFITSHDFEGIKRIF
jgi:hypothetical protein